MTNPPDTPLTWTEDGQPRSALFGDVYFSAEDGLAETRAVFLEGCGLPDAWRGRSRFTVGELGFGTGLNIAALVELWRRTREPEARLHIFSIEAHPVVAPEAARALARWPELAWAAGRMTARWPGRARGLHRMEIPEAGVILDLAVMDVAAALEGWSGAADAWFLDGFSPALNPAMWTDEVLGLVATRSAPGARAATFTVAGQVRRGLAAAGFEVEKRPGHGRKRERLEGRLPGARPTPPTPGRIAIVGGGIAGAAAARAVRALGGEAVLVEAERLGAGGSGNPAALVTPRLDAGLGPPAALFAQAFARAVALYAEHPDAILARGVLQLAAGERDPSRFARLAASDLFEPGSLALLSPDDTGPAALSQNEALAIDPEPILEAWGGEIVRAEVAALDAARLLDADGRVILEADAVIVAAGQASARLVPGLPLTPVRGQASLAQGLSATPTAWGGYVLPTRDGLLFGATHDRGDEGLDIRAADHARNLATLAEALPALAARIDPAALTGRAAIRATTPDRLPIAGGAGSRFLLTGFGSRGFSFAPLLAEHVAALALGAPSPLPQALAKLVDPGRFAERARRRGAS